MASQRDKYLLKNTAIFALGSIATKIITFFLVPLYTNVLSAKQYGILDLILTIGTIAIPIITFNISESVMRFNLDKDAQRNKITKIGIVIILFEMIIGLILFPISLYFEDTKNLGLYIYLYVLFSASNQIFLCDLRGKELLVQYSIGQILNTALVAGLNIFFLIVLKKGIVGYLLAYCIANGLTTIYSLIIGKGYKAINEKIDWNKMKEMLKYSSVLIPNTFMWWIMNSSDHIMVTNMVGVEANGIYAISYKLPTLISTFTQIFNQAWGYSAIKEQGSEDEEEYNNKVFRSMIGIVLIVGISMMTFIKPFLKIYVSKEFFSAWKYTPFLIIGCVYLTLGTFMATSYSVHKDSVGLLISGSFGAVLNISLNFILIPHINVFGAALATCISYLAVFVFRLVHTRKYIKYHVFTKEFIIGTIVLIVSSVIIFNNALWAQIIQIILWIFTIVLFNDIWLPSVKSLISKTIKR